MPVNNETQGDTVGSSNVDLMVAVTRIEGKVDGFLGTVTALSKVTDDHEARIRAMEKSRWPLASVTTLLTLGSATAAVFALIGK